MSDVVDLLPEYTLANNTGRRKEEKRRRKKKKKKNKIGKSVKPVLNLLGELFVRRTYFGQFDEL